MEGSTLMSSPSSAPTRRIVQVAFPIEATFSAPEHSLDGVSDVCDWGTGDLDGEEMLVSPHLLPSDAEKALAVLKAAGVANVVQVDRTGDFVFGWTSASDRYDMGLVLTLSTVTVVPLAELPLSERARRGTLEVRHVAIERSVVSMNDARFASGLQWFRREEDGLPWPWTLPTSAAAA